MAREDFLCSAVGSDGTGTKRQFIVKLHGRCFKIYKDNDQGYSHPAGSLAPTEENIENEIINVFNVSDVEIQGSIRQGVLSSTWPLSCKQCANCGCEATRRRYGGRLGGQGYCGACFGVIKRKDAATKWDYTRPETWRDIGLPKSHISNSFSAERFERYRGEFIGLADIRLSELRDREDKRKGEIPVDGAEIEALREYILKVLRRKGILLKDNAYIEEKFSAEQRRILYILFAELIENVRWNFPWHEALGRV